MFKVSAGTMNLTQLNMISYIFYFNLIIQSYIGSVIILLFDVPFNTLVDGVPLSIKVFGWAVVMYTMLALPLGMWLSNLFLKQFKMKSLYLGFVSKSIKLYSFELGYLKLIIIATTVICAIVLLYLYMSIGFIPFLKTLSVDSEIELFKLRTSISRSFPGNVYVKNILGLNLIPILSFVWAAYLLNRKTLLNWFFFITTFLMSFFMLTYDIAKSPFLFYLQGFLFLYIYMNGKVNKKTLLKYGLLMLILLIIIYGLIVKRLDFDFLFSYNSGITGRIFINQISGLYPHLNIFPEKIDFLGFDTLSSLLTNYPKERSARLVLETVSPGWIEQGFGGVYNTLFMGEAWANFGWYGLLLSPLWVGFIIQTFFIALLKSRKNPIVLSLLIYFSYRSNVTGGFNEYVYNPINILVILILVLAYVFSKYFYQQNVFNTNG